MKLCPQCSNTYQDTVGFCPRDGQVLEDIPTDMVGQVLDGQYEIEAFIARGGMGTLYRARHILLGDGVVIKTLRPDMRSNSEWLRRFQQEGRAARRFRHPNSVTVYDLRTTQDGLVYLVMEYVEGHTLDKELEERGHFTPEDALAVLEPVARALNAAHAMGVVHRDLKPQNVMLHRSADHQLTVKLLDLGIAKLRDVAETKLSDGGAALTVAGQILGTPYYMSPEQWGEMPRDGNPEIDGRADIYSLGVMFYELVTGHRPYNGQTLAELREGHVVKRLPPLQEVAPNVPPAFGHAIERAMSKDRGDRQATAGELADELRAALGLAPTQDAPPPLAGRTLTDINSSSQTRLREDKLTSGGQIIDRNTKSLGANGSGIHVTESPPSIMRTSAQVNAEPVAPTGTIPTEPARSSRMMTLVIAGIGLMLIVGLLAAIGGLVWWRSNSTTPVKNTNQPLITSNTKTNSAPAKNVEVLNYWVEAFDNEKQAKGERVANANALKIRSGQQIKFHFTPRERGYIYILGPGNANAPTTFLTAQPVGILKTNQVAAGADFTFPYGERQVLKFDKNPGTEEYTVIFSQMPLLSPSFFAEKAMHELSPQEVGEFEEFRAAHKTSALVENVKNEGGDQSSVAVSLPEASVQTGTIIFEIRIEHQ